MDLNESFLKLIDMYGGDVIVDDANLRWFGARLSLTRFHHRKSPIEPAPLEVYSLIRSVIGQFEKLDAIPNHLRPLSQYFVEEFRTDELGFQTTIPALARMVENQDRIALVCDRATITISRRRVYDTLPVSDTSIDIWKDGRQRSHGYQILLDSGDAEHSAFIDTLYALDENFSVVRDPPKLEYDALVDSVMVSQLVRTEVARSIAWRLPAYEIATSGDPLAYAAGLPQTSRVRQAILARVDVISFERLDGRGLPCAAGCVCYPDFVVRGADLDEILAVGRVFTDADLVPGRVQEWYLMRHVSGADVYLFVPYEQRNDVPKSREFRLFFWERGPNGLFDIVGR